MKEKYNAYDADESYSNEYAETNSFDQEGEDFDDQAFVDILEENDTEVADEIPTSRREVQDREASAPQNSNKNSQEAIMREADARSIHISNVEYSTTPLQLKSYFSPFGEVARVTIMNDKFTCRPLGYAYVEFEDEAAVVKSLHMDETELNGRTIHVSRKRTNIRGFNQKHTGAGRGRGRGGWGRGRGGGMYYPPYPGMPWGVYPPPPMYGRGGYNMY